MSSKSMAQLLIPFLCAVVIVGGGWLIGIIIGVIGDGILGLSFCWEIYDFLWIFSGVYPVGSSVFAVICWIILTAYCEITITEDFEK